MMEQSLFEQMGGKYEQQGEYLLPFLTLPAEEEQPVGIWGQRHANSRQAEDFVLKACEHYRKSAGKEEQCYAAKGIQTA